MLFWGEIKCEIMSFYWKNMKKCKQIVMSTKAEISKWVQLGGQYLSNWWPGGMPEKQKFWDIIFFKIQVWKFFF